MHTYGAASRAPSPAALGPDALTQVLCVWPQARPDTVGSAQLLTAPGTSLCHPDSVHCPPAALRVGRMSQTEHGVRVSGQAGRGQCSLLAGRMEGRPGRSPARDHSVPQCPPRSQRPGSTCGLSCLGPGSPDPETGAQSLGFVAADPHPGCDTTSWLSEAGPPRPDGFLAHFLPGPVFRLLAWPSPDWGTEGEAAGRHRRAGERSGFVSLPLCPPSSTGDSPGTCAGLRTTVSSLDTLRKLLSLSGLQVPPRKSGEAKPRPPRVVLRRPGEVTRVEDALET